MQQYDRLILRSRCATAGCGGHVIGMLLIGDPDEAPAAMSMCLTCIADFTGYIVEQRRAGVDVTVPR